jgi:hypothetical protein
MSSRVRFIAVVGAACVTVASGAVIATATGLQGGQVQACAGKATGALRLAATCQKGERRVSWSENGPAGLQGPIGPTGAVGPA